MKSFHDFWDKLNGKMYEDVPAPVKYKMADYTKAVSNGSPMANTEDGDWQLRPINHEDTASYAADDVIDWYSKNGQNSTKLGPLMTDDELKQHYGHTW